MAENDIIVITENNFLANKESQIQDNINTLKNKVPADDKLDVLLNELYMIKNTYSHNYAILELIQGLFDDFLKKFENENDIKSMRVVSRILPEIMIEFFKIRIDKFIKTFTYKEAKNVK
ncbi:35417_t:CDS:1, partial [Racocetra persica]